MDNKASRYAPAYTLVDLSDLNDDLRKEIIEDAHLGGEKYGVKVVELAINGPISHPIFGVYKDVVKSDGTFHTRKSETGVETEIGNDATKWERAKADFALEGIDVSDEEALRNQADAEAADAAAAIRAQEEAEIAAITHEDLDEERESSTGGKNKMKGK